MEKAGLSWLYPITAVNYLLNVFPALRNQTRKPDAILVVNNGSTDNTEAWLNQQQDVFFITQKNIGSGGGFNTGISWAYKHGYSWDMVHG